MRVTASRRLGPVTLVFAVLLVGFAAPAGAQPDPGQEGPAIRRWLDVQTAQATARFRWVKSNDGRITSSTVQWQPQLRARLLFDRARRYTLAVGAQSGSHFVSGWNDSGVGAGEYAGDFHVRQLYLSAEVRPGVVVQAGGLSPLRGENTEITSYDNDAFIAGERVVWRREGLVDQLAATAGFIGDYRTPNVFDRFRRMDDWNYGQVLVGLRVTPQVAASADYTYEDGRDLLREGLTIRFPELPVLTSVKLEAYHRLTGVTGHGVNGSGELRFTRAFTVTAGVAHVDRHYLVPGYTSPNGDRYERGTRFYTQGTYALTRELSIGWFQGEAFSTPYAIPNEHRFEILLSFNPMQMLRARGVL